MRISPWPHRFSGERDFSLKSGERQTGVTLDDIRYDHKVRYQFAIDCMKKKHLQKQVRFGLDLFCGTGYGAYMLSTGLSCAMLGIDGSADAISFANSRYFGEATLYSHKEFPFRLPCHTFDLITCYESLEHVEDGPLLVKQLVASLKKGGYLFLSTPNEKRFPLRKNFNKFHYKHYTIDELSTMVDDAGELELITWLGQNLYILCDGKNRGNLPDEKMNLTESREGQLLIFVFKKKDNQ